MKRRAPLWKCYGLSRPNIKFDISVGEYGNFSDKDYAIAKQAAELCRDHKWSELRKLQQTPEYERVRMSLEFQLFHAIAPESKRTENPVSTTIEPAISQLEAA